MMGLMISVWLAFYSPPPIPPQVDTDIRTWQWDGAKYILVVTPDPDKSIQYQMEKLRKENEELKRQLKLYRNHYIPR